ncbi:8299_t:CDS:2, partial [Funneliformis caledonium]
KNDNNDNSLLPTVKFYMELNPGEQVVWLPCLNWTRKLYSLIARQEMFLFQSTFFSVIGGAYSALGRYNKEHAEKAKHLARNQIILAKKLRDPVLECKCWIYYAEGLIQLGKFKKSALIIERQKKIVADMLKSDETLLNMCESAKLKLMANSTKNYNSRGS